MIHFNSVPVRLRIVRNMISMITAETSLIRKGNIILYSVEFIISLRELKAGGNNKK